MTTFALYAGYILFFHRMRNFSVIFPLFWQGAASRRYFPFAWLLLFSFICVFGTRASADATILRAVPTYENCSIYIEGSPTLVTSELRISYRQSGTDLWRQGHALAISSSDPVPRCSLFGLKENTTYDVKCTDTKGAAIAEATFRTWRTQVPVARTIYLKDVNPKGEPYTIPENGTAQGWIRYVGGPDYVIKGDDKNQAVLLLKDASYVIVENVVVKGGRRHGIQITNSNHVQVRNCDISGYGRVGVQDVAREGKYYLPGEKHAINYDSGVYLDLVSSALIEHNYIHDARGHANSWFYSHPAGPNAIFVRAAKEGGIVIRYNDLVGSEQHRWNDVIEAYGNGNIDGGFNCDSDIYGNFLAFGNDDGIELDGGQCNVRFYGNKVEGMLCGISTAPNLRGPSYVFNNLIVNLGDERGIGSAGVKNGGGTTNSKGITCFYHNIFFSRGHGTTGIGYGKDEDRRRFLGVSRNNIYAVDGFGIYDTYAPSPNDFDYDLFSTTSGGKGKYDIGRPMEPNAVLAAPGFVDAGNGLFALRSDSPALGTGVAVTGMDAGTSADANARVDRGPVAVPEGYSIFPRRPVPLVADKYQVVLTTYANEPVSDGETVVIKAGALAQTCKVRLLKNDAADWLQVTPGEGELMPGGTFTFKVKMDAKTSKRGLLLGAVVCKLETGDSLPITVYGMVAPSRFSKVYEAEKSEGFEQFMLEKDNSASAGAAIRLVDAEAGTSGKGAKAIILRPEIAEAGAYYLYFRVKCPQPYPLHDSLFLSVNGEEPVACSVSGTDDWNWIDKSGKQQFVDLKKGANVIKIIPREEIVLDCVLLQSKPRFPGDAMPAAGQ